MRPYTLFILFLLFVSLAGCRTARQTQQPVTLPDSTGVRVTYRHVTIFDTVPVTLPRETSSVRTIDTVSHLETSVAESDAWLTADGHFCHTLSNKPSLPIVLPRDTVWQIRDSIRIIYQPQPVTVEIPRKVTFIEKLLMITGGIFLLLIAFWIASKFW